MTLVRLAALLALLQGAAHGVMVLTYRPAHGPDELLVVETMRRYVFSFGGVRHSYWDLYFGYGLVAAGACFVEAALLWITAPLARSDPGRLRAIVALVTLANLAHATIVARFFFYTPLVADLVIAAVLAVAFLALSRRPAAGAAPAAP
jgi:hypothetical protein